jgi:hypothetical protein
MMVFDWTDIAITVSPLIPAFFNVIGVFDIGMTPFQESFKDCTKKLRDEKFKIWKKIIQINNSTLAESDLNDQLIKTLEEEERYDILINVQNKCKRYFIIYYYYLLPLLFIIGLTIWILKNAFTDVFIIDWIMNISSVIAILAIGLVALGMIILLFQKKKLTEAFRRVIPHSSSPINL